MAPSTSTGSSTMVNGQEIEDGAASSKRVLPLRVLPSRVRRGGTGVGQNDIDQMILDTYERQSATSIIPETAKFILTTDSKLIPPMPLDHATRPDLTKYFSRPEIINSMKVQREIQTPEFTPLSAMPAVGGRLRMRGAPDDNIMDMSDEAYLRRHRRYEAFEKKQRRREKEKLVHEQYKLRQRIDELRGFDMNAFAISGLPQESTEERRKVILETAEALDRRYSTLLPPDPRRIVKRRAQSVGPSLARSEQAPPPPRRRGGTPAPSRARRELGLDAIPPLERVEEDEIRPPAPLPIAPKLKISRKSAAPRAKAATPAPQKLTIKLPARADAQVVAAVHSPVSNGGPPSPFAAPEQTSTDKPTHEPTAAPAPAPKRRGGANAGGPPRKRARQSAAGSMAARTSEQVVPLQPAHGVPVLLAAARRNAVTRERRTTRVVEPFGVKMPRIVEDEREFQTPEWAMPGYVDPDDDDQSVGGPPEYEDGQPPHGSE